MAFQPRGFGAGASSPELEAVLLADSTTFVVGNSVESYSTGYLKNGVKAKPQLGIIVAFVDKYGNPLPPTAYSAGSATSSDVQSITTSSSNVSGTIYYALVNTSRDQKYSVTVNGTLGTTVNSLRGHFWIATDSDTSVAQVLETSATRTAYKEWYAVAVDSADSTRLIVQLAGSEKLAVNLTQ